MSNSGAPILIVNDRVRRKCVVDIFPAVFRYTSHHVPDSCRRNPEIARLHRVALQMMYICCVTKKTAPILRDAVLQHFKID